MSKAQIAEILVVTVLAAVALNCGVAATAPGATSDLGGTPGSSTPSSSSDRGNTFADLQLDSHWNSYALLPPAYNICETCQPNGTEASWFTQQGIISPSLSGSSMQFSLGAHSVKYADILWNNKFTTRLADEKSVPNYHEFVYEVYFYGEDLEKSQALEFDINQFFDGKSFIWGHECRIAGGHEWDTWDNVNEHWVKSGIACNPVSNDWNHLVIHVARTVDDRLHFESITLNGVTHTVDRFDHPSATTWYGMTINYQMDGNGAQEPYTVYLDKISFSYK
ncbi:MAG TPA: hypothetical protein VGV15_13225 [Terriglobales bacterium]|nr:hypothetical protein [Terriglobales bacterium]